MFTDGVRLKLVAGSGGNGAVAWRREKYIPKGGPAGGNGGKGGSVILRASRNLYSLDKYRNRTDAIAKSGAQGSGGLRDGRSGTDMVLEVPCGTLVKDARSGEVLLDMTEDGQEWEICKGGKGGLGNAHFKTPTNRAPLKTTPGKRGQSCEVELELKLIADVGFVGFPNAGKSTLLTKLTSHQVKIGDYPFTTLVPNLSFIEFDDYSRLHLADIPGIIKDAHKNRGLGLEFLRHIERCNVLVYVIDAAGTDMRDPLEDFATLTNELKSYSVDLVNKPFLIVLNKVDRDESQSFVREFRNKFSHCITPNNFFLISALSELGIDAFKEGLRAMAQVNGKKYR